MRGDGFRRLDQPADHRRRGGGAINGTRKVLDWLAARGEMLDACVVGEPTSAEELGDMIKIGRRGSMTGRLDRRGRAGAYRLPASRRQRGAPARGDAARADRRPRSTTAPSISSLRPCRSSTIDIGNPASNVDPGDRARRLQHPLQRPLDERSAEGVADASGSTRSAANYRSLCQVSGKSFLVPPGTLSDCLAEAIRRVTGRTPGAQHHRRHLGCAVHPGPLPGRRVRPRRADDAQGRRARRSRRYRRA